MKVNNAVICLDCDEIFVGEECPYCLSHTYYPLRKWLEPLHSIKEIKEKSVDKNQIKEDSFPNDIYKE